MCANYEKNYLGAMEAQSALWPHVVMKCPLSQITIFTTTYHQKMIYVELDFR